MRILTLYLLNSKYFHKVSVKKQAPIPL